MQVRHSYLSFQCKSSILICLFYASPAFLFVFPANFLLSFCLSCGFPAFLFVFSMQVQLSYLSFLCISCFLFVFPVDFRPSSSSVSNCGFLCPSGTVSLSFSFLIMYGVLIYPMRVRCLSFFSKHVQLSLSVLVRAS